MTDLEEIRPQVERMARAKTRDARHLTEDAIQEAMIAAWQERAAHPDAPLSHAIRSARLRVSKVLDGKPLTGEPRHPGRRDAHDGAIPLLGVSRAGEEFLVAEPEDLRTADALATAEIREAVLGAVGELSDLDRATVHLRFWQDREWREIAAIVGRPAGTLMRRWTEIVRPALATSLAEVVA